MSHDAKSGTLRYAASDLPPHPLSALLGFQIVVLILAGIVLTPIIVLRAAGGSDEYAGWVVFAALMVCGITTIIQARPIGPFGAGHVLYMGTSGAFIAVSITAVQRGGIPLLATLVALSALIQFALAARLSVLRKLITPTVGGVVIMLIAVTVFPHVFRMLGEVPEGVDPTSWAAPITAVVTFVVSIAVTLFAAGQVRLWGPLIGVIAGTIVAGFFGLVDLGHVREVAWVGLPSVMFPGPDLSFDSRMWALLPAFTIVTIVGAVETFGDGIAIQRVSSRTQKPVDFKVVQGAVYADGLGNLISGVAGTMPNTTYSTSIAVADLTGVASRRVGVYGGGFMILLALFPKVSALIQSIPNPVIAAYVTVLLVLLFGHGMRLLFEGGGMSYENGIVACLAFWVGVGFQNRMIFPDHLPEWAHTLLDNGMTSGGLTALALTAVVALKHRSGGKIRVPATMAGIRPLHAFLEAFARRAGWDRSAVDRLLLAGEEAALFLVEKSERIAGGEADRIRVSARSEESTIVLELVSGPGAENIETLVDRLAGDHGAVEEAGLRILRSLVRDLRHLQFHQGDVLQLTVESKPLG